MLKKRMMGEPTLFIYPNHMLTVHRHSGDLSINIHDIPLLAAYGASNITRTASRIAFQSRGRGVVTQDMLAEIGPAYAELFGNGGEKGWKNDGKL